MVRIEAFAEQAAAADAVLINADIIVVQRNLSGKVLKAIERWQHLKHKKDGKDVVGTPVVVDFDDYYDEMGPSNVSYDYWKRNLVRQGASQQRVDPPALDQFHTGVALCGFATMPSKVLAKAYEPYAKTYVVPNYIQAGRYANRAKPYGGLKIIGWGGSMSHLQSFQFSGVGAALKRLCRDRVDVMVEIHTADGRVFNEIPVPVDRKVLKGWVSADDWPGELAKFAVSLAPVHGAYDTARSWIKLLEASIMRVPWVASRGPAYDEWGGYGRLVANNPKAWEMGIGETLDALGTPAMKAMLDAAESWAKAQDIDRNVDAVAATYQTIIEEFHGSH
jgi:hypothetical protein